MGRRRIPQAPVLVLANAKGEICEYPGLRMAGMSGGCPVAPRPEELIPLPPGSDLFVLPGRLPLGLDHAGAPVVLEANPYDPDAGIQAVAAFMAPAHTAILSAAFQRPGAALPPLPLFAYTAVGWQRGRFVVAAFRSDPDPRQDADQFNLRRLERETRTKLAELPHNRLVQHLGHCCLVYGCPAARNYFLGRWEAPLPCSPVCNARCVGCISLQPSGCCPSTQERIRFVPSPTELAEIAIPHLQQAPRPVASFGQGCEGEPLLQAETIARAIRRIRRETDRGTINLNSNASLPEAIRELAAAGLDSLRVSLNSARVEYHQRYYRPHGFGLTEVKESIRVMKRAGRFVSLNYFILPGFTDDPAEYEALCQLLDDCKPDLIQLRNLNMDPYWYLDSVGHAPAGPPLGIAAWRQGLRDRYPRLRFGYFNPDISEDRGQRTEDR